MGKRQRTKRPVQLDLVTQSKELELTKSYKLKEGVVLKPYGVNSLVNNDNLTDEMAVLFIRKGRAKEEDFIITSKEQK